MRLVVLTWCTTSCCAGLPPSRIAQLLHAHALDWGFVVGVLALFCAVFGKEWHEETFKVDKLTALTSLKLARCNNITDATALWMHDLAIPGKDNRPK